MFKVYNKLKEVFILSIFNKLKALSTKQGISQKDLATQFNMSYNSFNNIAPEFVEPIKQRIWK